MPFDEAIILWDLTRCLGGVSIVLVRRLLLDIMGHPAKGGMKGLAQLFGLGGGGRLSPITRERMRFEAEVHEQFVKLKEKGISIPVFTL